MSYATVADLYVYGAPEKAFGQLSTLAKDAALDSASNDVDSYIRGRYSMPLIEWDTSITEATCRIAAYNLLNVRGYNPAAGADINIKDRYDQSIAWLRLVQKQQAHPNVVPQPDNSPAWNQPFVITGSVVNLSTGAKSRIRGW